VHVNPRIKEGERISGRGGGRGEKRGGGGESSRRKNWVKTFEGEKDYVREERAVTS
jgi:hypothetical protein